MIDSPKPRWQLLLVVSCAWLLMPVMTIWLMLTHPGKCAVIWKRELTGTWFQTTQVPDEMALVPKNLPYSILGEAAIAGVFETGNPKHGWDFILAKLAALEAQR